MSRDILVHGLAAPGQRFDRRVRARDISLRGMSLLLPLPLPLDTVVLAENPATGLRTLYRVVHRKRLGKGVYSVGFEAPDPHPRFWSESSKK